MAIRPARIRRKLFELDTALLQALERLARDQGVRIDTLADQAFRDLLRKHRRPVTLKEALRHSVRAQPANDPAPKSSRRSRT